MPGGVDKPPMQPAAHQSWAVDFATHVNAELALSGGGDKGHESPLTDAFIQKLFRIFLVFTDELDDDTQMTYTQLIERKQRLSVDEVRALCALISREIGIFEMASTSAADGGHICDGGQLTDVSARLHTLVTHWQLMGVPWPQAGCACCTMLSRIGDYPQTYTFREFIWTLARVFPDRCVIEAAVDSVFQRICNQVIKHVSIHPRSQSSAYRALHTSTASPSCVGRHVNWSG
jgi:hypothetical protein